MRPVYIPRKEIKHSDKDGYIRLDSFLSKTNEYLNFYILNLVMKIKVKFYRIEEFTDLFYDKLKLKEKIVTNQNIIINESDTTILNKAYKLLNLYKETFYTY